MLEILGLKMLQGWCLGEVSAEGHETESRSPVNVPRLVIQRYVKPVSWKSLRIEVFFFSSDIITDLKQLLDLCIAGRHILGGIMLFIFTGSLWVQLLRCDWCHLRTQMEESASRKVKTDRYLRILHWEKSFESHLALLLSAYSLRFSMTRADAIITGYIGLFFSLHNFSNFIFERLLLT